MRTDLFVTKSQTGNAQGSFAIKTAQYLDCKIDEFPQIYPVIKIA